MHTRVERVNSLSNARSLGCFEFHGLQLDSDGEKGRSVVAEWSDDEIRRLAPKGEEGREGGGVVTAMKASIAAVFPTLWEPQTSTVTHFVARNAVRCSLSLSPMILNPKTARRRCMALRAGAGMAAILPIAPGFHTHGSAGCWRTRPASKTLFS
jgi:hypothetical protein